METEEIKIKIQEGKTAIQESKNGSIVISFKDKPKGEILDRINAVEDALGEADEQTKQDYLKAIGGYTTPDRTAEEELKLIIKVVNEDVIFDYADPNQKKWFPVFRYSPGSGFVFAHSLCGYSYSYADSGSRLFFSTEKKCETIAKRFIEKYNRMLL